MSVTLLDAPRPLPSVPCLTYAGKRVQWAPWEKAPRVLCSKLDQSCGTCPFPGPLATALGKLIPHDGETIRHARKVGTYPSGRPKFKGFDVPAHAYYRLSAFLCPQCFHLDVLDHSPESLDATRMGPAEMVLCDGCDVPCGIGVDLTEARANLVTLGGWTGGDADWDLCPTCNPERNPDPPPRALEAMRALRAVAPR